jgi:tRNA(Ile)-lysidine synthase TilS/MesJ
MIPLALAQSDRSVAVTPEVSSMLDRHCPVAIGVSGGKDSAVCTELTLIAAEQTDRKGAQR